MQAAQRRKGNNGDQFKGWVVHNYEEHNESNNIKKKKF